MPLLVQLLLSVHPSVFAFATGNPIMHRVPHGLPLEQTAVLFCFPATDLQGKVSVKSIIIRSVD